MAGYAAPPRGPALSELPAPQPAAPQLDRFGAPWGLLGAAGALLLTLMVIVVGQGAYAQLAGIANTQNLTLTQQVILYQFLVLGVIVSATVLMLYFRVGPGALGYVFPGWNVFLQGAVAVIPVYIGVAVVELFFTTALPGYHLHSNLNEVSVPSHANLPSKILLVVWVTIEAPLAEETLFRGILFQGLRHFFGRFTPDQVAVFFGALLSGLTFGLAHFEPHTFPILAFLGIALAYVFQRARSLWASITVHAIFNALAAISILHG